MTSRWCVRCKEDDGSFEVATEPADWAMGMLRSLMRGLAGDCLCGNCYFDLKDIEEEAQS